jgi:gliding motility-associated-like protein
MQYTHYPFQKLFALTCLLCATAVLPAQTLQVTDATQAPFTPQNLVSNVLLGNGVTVTNITYNGVSQAVGYFTGGQNTIGIERGIVMSTGLVETSGGNFGCSEDGNIFANNANGSNATDANLDALTTDALSDVSVYSITFIPTSDTLRFRYCFGSEEYPEFACSAYNDIFGFFIQGPGFPTAKNIALIPGTNLPVAINNLHPQNGAGCGPVNEQFYINNLNSTKQPVYDGYTQVFTAEAVVQPCQQYTITLAIADVGDSAYDSGVFLEAKSFGTGSLRAEVVTTSPDGILVEGCAQGSITFRLPSPEAQDFPIDYTIFGSAVNGVDYQNIPANLVIPAGQTELVIPIIALQDNLNESQELLAFDFRRDICSRDTLYISLKDNGLLPPALLPDTALCQNAPALQLNGTLPITLPPPPSFSNFQDFQIPFLFGPVFSNINVFGVTPNILSPTVLRSVCLNISHSWDDDIDMYLISPGGQFIELSTDNGGSGNDYTNTCFTPTATTKINFPGPFAPASATPFTGNWLPEGQWSDLWDGEYPTNGVWRLQLRDDALGNVGNLRDWTITFEPLYKVNYQWTPIVGVSCPTCPITNITPTQPTTYTVVATDSYGCSVSDSIRVDILPRIEAPTVNCTSFGTGMASFSWNNVVNATSFEVNVNGTGWVPASGLLLHNVSGLPNNAPVTLEVRGTNPAYACAADIGSGLCCQKPAPAIAIQDVACFGGNSGTIQLTPDGSNPPYAYNLGAQTNGNGLFQNLTAGIYTVTITDGSGCSNTLPLTVASKPALNGNTSLVQDVRCFGGDDGQLSASATGGTAGYTYTWSGTTPQTGVLASNLSVGTYTVTITDSNNCTSTASGLINQPPDLILNIVGSTSPCFSAPAGSATASGSGGVAPYQYTWSNGPTTAVNANIVAGNYTVTISDANGCAETTFVIVGEAPALTTNLTKVSVTCFGSKNGTATANPNGGTGPYTYQWNTTPIQTTQTATGLAAQTYTVTITDANSCTLAVSIAVDEPPALSVTSAQTNVDCNSNSTGNATVTPTGGTAPYTFIWNDPAAQTLATASNLSAGTYTVTISDGNACTSTRSLTLTQPNAIQVLLNPTDASCFGKNDGKISLNATGGTPTYSFLWSSGENTQNLNNKLATTYTVTVTDAQACTAVATDSIGQPSAIIINIANQAVRCFGEASGAITLDIFGGTPAYSTKWTGPNGFTANDTLIFGLFAGNYAATITDANACTVTLNEVVTQPAAALVIQLPEFADTICFAASDGRANVQIFGGTAPFSYQWEGNGSSQTTPVATGLSPGNYTVTITDANLCSQTGSTIVTQKDQLFAIGAYNNPRCFNGADGSAYLSAIFYGAAAADGTSFSYQWSTVPVQNTAVATGLTALQTYQVTLTDAQGCSASSEVTLGNPDSVQARIVELNSVLCFGDASGSAIGAGFGGTAPYQYFWSPGAAVQTDSIAIGLRAGTYFLTVTDAKGCPDITTVRVTEPSRLLADLFAIPVLCFGDATGGAVAFPKGGVAPYQINWSTGASTDTVRQLPTGPVYVTITDKNGCVFPGLVNVPEPAAPLSGNTTKEDPACFGGRDGKMTIVGSGGTPPYRYALNDQPFIGASVQIGLQAGSYTPKIIDRNGCIVSLPPTIITQPDQLIVDLGPDFTLELGKDTQLVAQVLNGVNPVQFAWNLTDSIWLSCLTCPDPLVEKLFQQRWFKVTAVDANGCEAEDRILISVERPRRIFVPTGFSPNDDSENDRLVVHGQNSAKVTSFRVYDRWGEMVFETLDIPVNDVASGWDGTFRGKALDPGVYVWVVEATYLDGQKEVLHGNTTLIR